MSNTSGQDAAFGPGMQDRADVSARSAPYRGGAAHNPYFAQPQNTAQNPYAAPAQGFGAHQGQGVGQHQGIQQNQNAGQNRQAAQTGLGQQSLGEQQGYGQRSLHRKTRSTRPPRLSMRALRISGLDLRLRAL